MKKPDEYEKVFSKFDVRDATIYGIYMTAIFMLVAGIVVAVLTFHHGFQEGRYVERCAAAGGQIVEPGHACAKVTTVSLELDAGFAP